MSLDFYIEENKPTELYWENITHNLAPMWRAAGVYDALYNSEGLKAGDIIPFLRKGLAAMRVDPVKYEKLNAPNRWGTYPHAVEFLEKVLKGCRDNPNGTIRISA